MGIKKVKLYYKPVAVRRTNEIAYVVSSNQVNAVNKSIERKCARNISELVESEKAAKDYVVKSSVLVKKSH